MGKELDLAFKGLFRDKRGRIKHVQLYRNAVDDTMFICKNLKFVEVIKINGFYVIKI